MYENECFENYPARFVLLANLLSFSVYFIGCFIVSKIGTIFLILYLLYIIFIELRLQITSCRYCYYYDKYCFSGRGKICAILFKKGDKEKFIKMKISWYTLIPDFLVFLIPLIIGIIILISNFSLLLLGLIILLTILSTWGNAYIRGCVACKHCKQRMLGCPAEKFFNKNK